MYMKIVKKNKPKKYFVNFFFDLFFYFLQLFLFFKSIDLKAF